MLLKGDVHIGLFGRAISAQLYGCVLLCRAI